MEVLMLSLIKKIMKKEEKKEESKIIIDEAINNLTKKYGSNTVMRIDKKNDFKIEWIPTNCFLLESIIGGPGLPRGRLIEMAGREAGGKTSLSLFLIAQLQKNGGRAAFIDAEHSFNSEYSKNIGVDTSKLFLAQPGSLEEGFDILRELVNTKQFDLIVLDSVAALTPKAEIEEDEMLKTTVALRARLISKALSILTGEIAKSGTSVVFINQVRDTITAWGPRTITPGGRALKFYASLRLDITNGKKIEKNNVQIGTEMILKTVKNKIGMPSKKTTLNLYFAKGIDLHHDAFSFGEQENIIIKTGNTYTFKETTLGVGRDKAIQTIKEDPKLFEEIKKTITSNLNKQTNDDTKTQ